jgi:hypothetical protein
VGGLSRFRNIGSEGVIRFYDPGTVRAYCAASLFVVDKAGWTAAHPLLSLLASGLQNCQEPPARIRDGPTAIVTRHKCIGEYLNLQAMQRSSPLG